MNIILSGYGKMGKEVESVAVGRNHVILAKFDRPEDWKALEKMAGHSPVVIDFSQPEAVHQNILRCFRHDVPVVVGTTGWNDQLPEMIETCRKGHHTLLTGSNFSIGMNLFFALNKYLASLMDNQEAYGVTLEETHHVHKLDKPSGTAITLAEQLIERLKRKSEWTPGHGAMEQQIAVHSKREGEVFGDHTVRYDSAVDRIEISHSAKSRKGFALGAVLAAEWLQGKTGYFDMNDFLGL
jgi:4-hydroxy-tetrahydrodipicolinate reductase